MDITPLLIVRITLVGAVCLIVFGLIKGITFGMGEYVRRKDRPVVYWCWILLYIIGVASLISESF